MAQYWQSETKRSENKMDINLSKAQYSEMYKEASKGTKWWVTIPEGVFIWRTYMRYWAIAYGYVFIFRFIQG